MAAAVGPCHTAGSLGRVLGCSEDHIAGLIETGNVLALTTADDFVVFPSFQLDNDRLLPGLPPVLAALREGADDPWAWAVVELDPACSGGSRPSDEPDPAAH